MCKYALLLDDNPLPLVILTRILEKQGFCVVRCLNAGAAVDIYQANDFQIILCDGLLGVRKLSTGEEVTCVDFVTKYRRWERESSKDPVPVICVSAHEGMRERFLAAGGTEYVLKPINTAQVKALLQKYVGGH